MSDDDKKRNWNPKDADTILDEVRDMLEQMRVMNEAHAEKIAGIRGQIAGAYKRAKALGLRPKSLKAIIKIEQLAKKQLEAAESLNETDQESLDDYVSALGMFAESPLGAFFVDKKREREAEKERASSALDSLTSDEQIEQNTERLESGISAL